MDTYRMIPVQYYCTTLYANGLYFDKHINIIEKSIKNIYTIDMWYGGYKSIYILKTAAYILRKRALEMYSLEDDSELREMLFELVVGIEAGINFLKLLNGQVEAWTQLFKSIDNICVHSNTKLLQVDFNGTDVHFKTYNK